VEIGTPPIFVKPVMAIAAAVSAQKLPTGCNRALLGIPGHAKTAVVDAEVGKVSVAAGRPRIARPPRKGTAPQHAVWPRLWALRIVNGRSLVVHTPFLLGA
jgi:hypothetical protein